jgi:hypothetical protein
MANGSSCCWEIAVEESLGGDGWTLELDGPHLYLVFPLADLGVLRKFLCFLQASPGSSPGKIRLHLGWFGKSSVALLRDNEDFPRCFLVIGAKARSTLRLSLEADDMKMLCEALQQVLDDLPEAPDPEFP